MRVQNCFFPKVVKNPYTGQTITCRCGKCAACLNQRSNTWVQRLDMESQCHKYTLFATITYDDFNVPQIIRMRFDDYPEPAYIDSESGQVFELSEIHETFTDNDKQYIKDSKVLNVLNKSDFQKFIKRLRYYFHETDPKNSRLSYYICGEYGPRTFRPHGHMLLFFESDKCQQNIEVLLSKAWPFGHIYDPHLVHGTASEYCASYINSLANLPKVYLHRWLRPFTLFSKSPSIGSCYPVLQKTKELVNRGDITFRIFHRPSGEFRDVPFWRSFETRLYPRCQRFSSLSHADRMRLYRGVAQFEKEGATAERTAQEICKIVPLRKEDCLTFFQRYLWTISHRLKYKYHFFTHDFNVPSNLRNLPFLPFDTKIESDINATKQQTYEFVFDSLVRFVRTTRLLSKNALEFDLSLNDYDLKIEKYYEKRDLNRLKKDYQYQDEYFAINPKWHYIYFDKGFYDKVLMSDYESFTPSLKFYINDLFNGKVPFKYKKVDNTSLVYKYVDIPPLELLPDFTSMVKLQSKIAKDLTKTKENNDYAKHRRDKFSNIINYQNL